MLHHIMLLLVINGLGSGHTDTHISTCKPKHFQETRRAPVCGQHAPGLKIFIDSLHGQKLFDMNMNILTPKFPELR